MVKSTGNFRRHEELNRIWKGRDYGFWALLCGELSKQQAKRARQEAAAALPTIVKPILIEVPGASPAVPKLGTLPIRVPMKLVLHWKQVDFCCSRTTDFRREFEKSKLLD